MKSRKNFYIVLSYLIISFICMLFLTTASPLFTVNPSSDGNTMFTIGKGLWHGLMPYKDLFDQRGPLIYLLHSVAALISYRSFLGIYIFESLALFIDLFFIYKILNLRYSTKLSIISSFTIIPFAFNSSIFTFGDLPEEFMLPLIFMTIYYLTRKSVNDWGKFEYIMMGLFASIAFWVKFPMTVTWIAVYLVLVIYFIYRRSWKKLFTSISYAVIGFLPITLCIIALYAVKHALGSLYYVYFYLNVTSHDHSVLVPPTFTKSYIIVAIVFLILYIQEYELSKFNLYVLTSVVVLNYAYLWKFGWINYYYELFVFVFLVAPVVVCMVLNDYKSLRKMLYFVPVLTIIGIYVSNNNFSDYSTLSNNSEKFVDFKGENKTPIMKKFASIIDKSKDKTILNYRRLDNGIYTYSGTLPNNKYFMQNNMNYYKPMVNAQGNSLKSKKYKFVFVGYVGNTHKTNEYMVNRKDLRILKNDYKVVAKRYSLSRDNVIPEKFVLYQRKY